MLDIVVFEEAGNQPIRELRPFLGRKLQCLSFDDFELIRYTNPLSWEHKSYSCRVALAEAQRGKQRAAFGRVRCNGLFGDIVS